MSMYLLGSDTERSIGRLGGFRKRNYAPTLEEAISLIATGPLESERGASVVPVYESDFSSDAAPVTSAVGSIITANQDAIDGEDDWLKIEKTSGAIGIGAIVPSVSLGKRASVTIKIYNPIGSNITHVGLAAEPTGTGTNNYCFAFAAVPAGTSVTLASTYVHQRDAESYVIRACNSSGRVVDTATGQFIYVKNIINKQIGITADYTPSMIQLAPGQWLDSANGKHWHIPDGFRLGRPRTTGQLRGVNTWDNDATPQPLNGVDLNCIPADAEVTIRAKVGAGSHTFDIGDGVDGDRYAAAVTIGTDWTPIPLDKIASDGTNRKIVFTPSTAFDGTLTTSVRVVKLE